MIVEGIPKGTTQTGHCGTCDHWTVGARIIAELHVDTGCGGVALRCPDCDAKSARRRPPPRRAS